MISLKSFLFLGAGFLLAACATTPLTSFPSTNPLSPQAQEAPTKPFAYGLAEDEATRKSNAMLSASENGTLKPEPQSDSMSDMPGMNMGGSK
jgi:hypothetical protein